MAQTAHFPEYGTDVEIIDTETHRGDTMHKVRAPELDREGWVFAADLEGVDA